MGSGVDGIIAPASSLPVREADLLPGDSTVSPAPVTLDLAM